jgi:hypothetical protein
MSIGLSETVMPIDIARGFRPSQSRQLDNSQLYNFYVDSSQENKVLYYTPGNKPISTISYGKTARGIFNSDKLNKLIVVYDENVYLVGKNGEHQLLNGDEPLTTTGTPVFIAENHVNQIAISDGGSLFIYDFSTSPAKFSKSSIPEGAQAGMVDHQDGYFLLNDSKSTSWYISELPGNGGGSDWKTERRSQIDSKTVGIASFKRQVMVFGENGTEIFYDAGVIPMPFQKANTISFEYGCLTANSISKGYGLIFWLGVNKNSSPELMVSDGGEPVIITEGDISYFINQLTDLNKCESFVYQVNSHIFYQINWNKDNISLLYDFTEKKFSIVTDYKDDIHPIAFLTQFNNMHYALSRNDGFLHNFDVNLASDNGKAIRRSFSTENFNFRNQKFSVPKINLYLEQGIAKVPQTTCSPECEPCEDAQCYLLISHDKGITYPITRTKQLARLGQRKELLDFFNLGSDRFWTFKVVFISADRVNIFGMDMKVVK